MDLKDVSIHRCTRGSNGALRHLLNLLSSRHQLDVATTTLKEEFGRKWDIGFVRATGLDEGHAGYTFGLRVEVAAAVWK